MLVYFLRRLVLMVPTFFGISLLSFVFINMAPGGPIEQKIQEIRFGGAAAAGATGTGSGFFSDSGASVSSNTRFGDSDVNSEIIAALKKQYGFDKPLYQRYWCWLVNTLRFDFGESFTYQRPAREVILEHLPVTLQFGLLAFFLTQLLCVPLGVVMAARADSWFDRIAQLSLVLIYSMPVLIFAIVLIVLFAGANYCNLLPTGGIVSENYQSLSAFAKLIDRFKHLVLPLMVYITLGMASLTMLMRNSILDIISQDYIRTAQAKGLADRLIYFKHALRNALVPMVSGFASYLSMFLSGSIIIESVFRLNGLGLLSYNSLLARDYNVLMGLVFFSSIVLLFGRLISDLLYRSIDPRIDFK